MISNQTVHVSNTLTAGVTAFSFSPMTIWADSELRVVVTDSAGVRRALTLNTDYTVNRNNSTVNFVTAPYTTYGAGSIEIASAVPYSQEDDYSYLAFSPDRVEKSLDRATVQLLQLAYAVESVPGSLGDLAAQAIAAEQRTQGLKNDTAAIKAQAVNDTAAIRDQAQQALQNSTLAARIGSTGPASYRNKIRNPRFNINQRTVSGTVTLAAGAFGHDCWKAGANGCTYTFSTTNGRTTLNITAGSLVQTIDGSNLAAEANTHTLSWGGTCQGKVGAGSYGASGITGSATGGTNINIEFGTGTLYEPQFELGGVVSCFEIRPAAIDLLICRLYYRHVYLADIGLVRWGSYINTSYVTRDLYINLCEGGPMRAQPLATLIAGLGEQCSLNVGAYSAGDFGVVMHPNQTGICGVRALNAAFSADI